MNLQRLPLWNLRMAVSLTILLSSWKNWNLPMTITIHKSQGSEYPAVILPLLSGPKMLMNRNLLYTGVTRARKCVTVVGSEETFGEMIRNEKQQKRYSSLWDKDTGTFWICCIQDGVLCVTGFLGTAIS